MNKHIRKSVAVLLYYCALTSFGGQTNETPDAQILRSKYQEEYDKLLPVTIYGVVTDMEGAPVANAYVTIAWERATWMTGKKDKGNNDHVITDAKGQFSFTCIKPHRAFAKAQKEGYDDSNYISRDLIWDKTTPERPVLITLRKKGETTFLIQREGRQLVHAVSPNSKTNAICLFSDERDNNSEVYRYKDLELAADYVPLSNSWAVSYWATNGLDGIVLSNERLYIAPADGYRQNITVQGPPWPKYLYLRSRNPLIYTRLEMIYDVGNESTTNSSLFIRYKAWVNPYGERNLEYETSMDAQYLLRKQMEREIKEDFRQNKRPPKPDLPKRIKEFNEKLAKEKAR